MSELGIDPRDELPAGEEPKDVDAPEHTSETKEVSLETPHKLEAEQYIKDAIENEKKADNEYQKTLKEFAKLDDDVERIPAAPANEEGASGLASKVAYLEKLHEAGSGLGSSQMQKSDKADIASASTTDRIAKAGWVLKRAANFRQKSTGKRMGDESERGDLQESSPANTNNDDVEAGENAGQSPKSSHHSFGYGVANTARKGFRRAYENTVQEWSSLHDFFAPKRATIFHEFFLYTFILILPSLFVAVMLFYVGTNPSTGKCTVNDLGEKSAACFSEDASASWWIIFVGCRQVLIWLLARGSDIFFVDFLVLEHPFIVRILGPRLSLIAVQSKGWPSRIFWWGFWNALVLYGNDEFKHHWLFWQDEIVLFNDENPSGNVVTSDIFGSLILCAILGSILIILKRHWVGLHLGSRLYTRYNERLEESLKEVLLISELSLWARRKRDQRKTYSLFITEHDDDPIANGAELLNNAVQSEAVSDANVGASESGIELDKLMDFSKVLEPWEEPDVGPQETVSGNHIIEFQQAYSVVCKPLVFSSAFGPAGTREQTVKSAEFLFHRLLKLLADKEETSINLYRIVNWMYRGGNTEAQKKHVEEYTEFFNANEDGKVYIIDFVTSIDAVYRKLRVLRNNIDNSSHVDKAYEKIINVVFYFALFILGTSILGWNSWEAIVGLSAFIVSFGFMIGSGTAQLFEGVLLVLARKPYDIGDKIAIANADDQGSLHGSPQWMVESINLVTTTAKFMASGEVASFSNGALARMRIINANRSPEPVVHVFARFPTDVPYSTILIFRAAVERYVETHADEWVALAGFRTSRVEAELNFVEYQIVLRHASNWQNIVPILDSKAALASFAVEAINQLGCKYEPPKMGVEISMAGTEPIKLPGDDVKGGNLSEIVESAMEAGAKKDD